MGIPVIPLLIVVLILSLLFFYIKLPKRDRIDTSDLPDSYSIPGTNRMAVQQHNECAAFSSAYVLRHLGVDADGNELYKRYPRKLYDATITAKGIVVFFKKHGYEASFYRGNANTLKKRLTDGIPVIVFIRVYPDQKYLHFAPVTGYDDQYFYLADSFLITPHHKLQRNVLQPSSVDS